MWGTGKWKCNHFQFSCIYSSAVKRRPKFHNSSTSVWLKTAALMSSTGFADGANCAYGLRSHMLHAATSGLMQRYTQIPPAWCLARGWWTLHEFLACCFEAMWWASAHRALFKADVTTTTCCPSTRYLQAVPFRCSSVQRVTNLFQVVVAAAALRWWVTSHGSDPLNWTSDGNVFGSSGQVGSCTSTSDFWLFFRNLVTLHLLIWRTHDPWSLFSFSSICSHWHFFRIQRWLETHEELFCFLLFFLFRRNLICLINCISEHRERSVWTQRRTRWLKPVFVEVQRGLLRVGPWTRCLCGEDAEQLVGQFVPWAAVSQWRKRQNNSLLFWNKHLPPTGQTKPPLYREQFNNDFMFVTPGWESEKTLRVKTRRGGCETENYTCAAASTTSERQREGENVVLISASCTWYAFLIRIKQCQCSAVTSHNATVITWYRFLTR